MTTLEKLRNGAGTVADKAVKAGGFLLEKGKHEVTMASLQARLAKAQRQLGALVYALHKNGGNDEELINRYIGNIAAIEAEMEATGDKTPSSTATAQNAAVTTYCPQCGAEVDPNAIFCPGCGNKLGQ